MTRLPIEDKKIIELYKSGYSQNDIVQQYNVSVVYTRSVLKAAGLDTRGFRSLSPGAIKVINILVNAGVKYIDIEAVCDISFHAIRDYVNRNDCRSQKNSFALRKRSFPQKAEFLEAYREGHSFCFLLDNLLLRECDIIPAFLSIQEEDVVKHREGLRLLIEKCRADGLSNAGITRLLNISRSIIRNGVK